MKKYILMLAVALIGATSYVQASKGKKSSEDKPKELTIVGYNGGEIFRNYEAARKAEEGLFKGRRDLELYLQTQQGRRNALIEQINAENSKMEELAKEASSGDVNKAAQDEITANVEAISKQIRELDQDTITHRNFEMNRLQEEGQRTQQFLMERMKEATATASKECGASIAIDIGSPFVMYADGVKDISERIFEVLKQESEESEGTSDEEKAEGEQTQS